MASMSWDLVFRQPDSKPVGHQRDHAEWKALLADAAARDARLHDARHTAPSLLLLLEVPARVVMELLGHSSHQLTMNTCSHVAPELNTARRRSSWPERCGTSMNRSRPAPSTGDHRELWLPFGCQDPVSAPFAVRSTGEAAGQTG